MVKLYTHLGFIEYRGRDVFDENNYMWMYPQTGLSLLKHYLIGGTCIYFDDDCVSTYFPLEDGITCKMLAGTGSEYGKVYGPGTYLDLQLMTTSGTLERNRQILISNSGYSICLVSKLGCRIESRVVEAKNYKLQAHTKAIPLNDPVFFTDKNVDITANKFNMIMDRPYDLELNGTGKLMLININI